MAGAAGQKQGGAQDARTSLSTVRTNPSAGPLTACYRRQDGGELHTTGSQHRSTGGVQQMKRRIAVLALAFMAVALIAQQALAQNEHFIFARASLNNNGTLTVSFKEAGLGTNQLITYVASADATATYVCVNRGGGNPSASNKTTVAGPVSATGQFSSGKNGQVTASLTLSPPPSDISCPPGQSLELASVSYTNVTLTDTTNGVSIAVGDFTFGCLLPNVRGAC
jgi:hypothetical protein